MSKLRFKQFKNNKTEFKQLKELVNYLQPNKYLVENDNYSDQFSTPVLTPNKSFLLGYTSQNNTFDKECVIIDDFTLDVKYVNFPFMLKSGAAKILISDKMDIYYLYYLLLTYPFIINGHSRHYISYVQELEFKIPSIEEQKKIGYFFKEIDELINLYQTKKELTELLLKAFIQKHINYSTGEEVLVSHVLKERKEYSTKSQYEHLSLTKKGVHGKSNQYNRDHITNNINEKKFKITKYNDIVYNPANLKFNVIARNNYGVGVFSPIYITLECLETIDPDYAEFLFTSSYFIKKARKYEQGTLYERIAVNVEDFLKVKIVLPTLEEQKEISSKLKEIRLLLHEYDNIIIFLKQKKSYYLNKIFC